MSSDVATQIVMGVFGIVAGLIILFLFWLVWTAIHSR